MDADFDSTKAQELSKILVIEAVLRCEKEKLNAGVVFSLMVRDILRPMAAIVGIEKSIELLDIIKMQLQADAKSGLAEKVFADAKSEVQHDYIEKMKEKFKSAT